MTKLGDVVVITTTNRPDLIDLALFRPGRHVYVSASSGEARGAIFEVHTRNKPLAGDIGLDLDPLARETEDYVGADIEPVCREAATAVREFARSKLAIEEVDMTAAHFEEAFQEGDPESNRPAEGFTVGDT